MDDIDCGFNWGEKLPLPLAGEGRGEGVSAMGLFRMERALTRCAARSDLSRKRER
jgi:hypothetical protein